MSAAAPERCCRLRDISNGFKVLTVHWSSVPGYDYPAAKIGMSPEEVSTELDINWSASGGLRVYPEFKYAIHASPVPLPYNPNEPLHLGWDFGNSPACCITQINSMGQWQIFPSFYPEEREFDGLYAFAERVADHLLREYGAPYGRGLDEIPMVHVGDPAGRGPTPVPGQRANETISAFQLLNQGLRIYLGQDEYDRPIYETKPGWGWHVLPGEMGIKKRLDIVRARLTTLISGGLPALIVDSREEFITNCFLGGYHYKQYSDGTYDLRHPEKDQHSHCLAGHTLIETARGHIPISEVTTQDRVMTRKGWRRVLAAWKVGERTVFKVEFSDGRSLVGTAEHRIWADGKWTTIDAIKYNSIICEQRPSPITRSCIPDIPTPNGGRIGSISSTGRGRRREGSMWFFGKKLMGLSRRAGMSTTKTETLLTTRWRTWSVLRWPLTEERTKRWDPTKRLWFALTSKKSVPWRRRGTAPMKDGRGTPIMGREPGIAPNTDRASAITVGKRIRLAIDGGMIGFAARSAWPPLVETVALTMSSGSARTVAASLPSIDTSRPAVAPLRVLDVFGPIGTESVYDLTVEGEPEFYANGILVHNCMDAIAYAASRLFFRGSRPKQEGEFAEDVPRAEPFRSQSSTWHRG